MKKTWSLCELYSLVQKDGPRCGQEKRIKCEDSGFVFILLFSHFQLMCFWHRSASSTHKMGLYYVLKCVTGRFLHYWNGSVYLFLGDSVIWVNDDDDDRYKLGYRHPWRTVSNGHHNFSSACSFNLSIALVYDQSPAIVEPRHKKYFTWGHTCVLVSPGNLLATFSRRSIKLKLKMMIWFSVIDTVCVQCESVTFFPTLFV